MKLKNIEQPFKTKQFLDECMNTSVKSINVQKQFMLEVHQLCKKFSEDLQHLYKLLSVQVDDEETLSQNTVLSNYILSISHIIKSRSEILFEEAIEPFYQFEANYSHLNNTISKNYGLLLDNLKASNELLKHKAADYYEDQNQTFQAQNEQQYKLSLNQMNCMWEQFFKELPQYYEQYQLNEETRLTVTEQTFVKFIEALEYMFKQPAKITNEKLHQSFEIQREKFKTRDLYGELCIQSKKMIDFMNEPKCEMFTSRDEYFRNKAAILLQESDSSKNSNFKDEDFRFIKQLIEKPQQNLQLLYKIKLIPNLTSKEREEIVSFLLSELKQKNVVQLQSHFQSNFFRILIFKLFKWFEDDFQNQKPSSKLIQQFLQIIYISLSLKSDQGCSLLSKISKKVEIFYSQRLWNSIYEELLTNYHLQKQMIDITLKYVSFLQTPNSKIQLPKEIDQKQDSIFNGLFSTKTRKITQNESINIVNLILIASNLPPQTTSSIIMEIITNIQMKPSCSIPFIELQEANQMLKEFQPQIRQKQLSQKFGKRKNTIYCLIKSLKYLQFNENYLNVICISKEYSKTIKTKMIQYFLVSEQTALLNLQQRVRLWSELLDIEVNYKKIQQDYLSASKKLSREIERSIVVDIKRSFSTDCEQRDQIINQYEIKLENLLRLHAFDNPEISYYQGMNMLMVFFLYVTNLNEELSFRLFRSLLEKLLRDIFLEGLKSMRMHFYILDRLIAIFIPRLFIHWKQLQIESPQFATAWYVTLYTNSINLSQVENNQVCFDIFEIVIARGWTGFYQSTIGLLKFYEKILIELDFDQSQKFLNNLSKTQFYRQQIEQQIDVPYFSNVKNLKISIKKQLITELEREYYQLREKIDQINLNHL
ncbi:unnamed protein product [Paramecium primaurelia]|uniref:Rab-GAP TBC domain-containing protein n=1 Tax=Paramecium primaurelia TaxID=5886 RepID=A0A8S1JSX8_PARPR|nr:unnamed protein product [Paramecium primaurelia]